MKYAAALLLVIFVSFLYAFMQRVEYEVDSMLTQEQQKCSREMLHVSMDNPLERIPLTKVKISSAHNGGTTATAYFFVFPYAEFLISKGCNGARRI